MRRSKEPPPKLYRAGFPNGNGYPFGFDDMPGRTDLSWSNFRAGLVRRLLGNEPWECGWRAAAHDDSYIQWHLVR